MTYQKRKQQVLQLYDQAVEITKKLKEPDICKRLEEQRKHLSEGKLFVVVCGEFKQGKSQLLNALLNEEELFPVDVDITTNLVSTISYAQQEKISVALGETGQEKAQQISRSQIPDYVTEQKNQGNKQQARMLMIEAPNLQLKEGLVLVDTPGTGSLNTEHTAISYAFIPYADAILFVSDAQAPLTTNELTFVKERIAPHCQNLIFVITKIDAVRDYQAIVESNRNKLAEILEKSSEEIAIIPVSSQAKLEYCKSEDLEDLEDSNFEVLESKIWKLIGEQRGQILLMKALSKLQQGVNELKSPLQTEWEAYQEHTQQELDNLKQDFEQAQQRRQELLDKNAEWRTHLNDGIQDIQIQIQEQFQNGFAKIRHQAEKYLDDPQLMQSPKQIADLIEADIDAVIVELNKEMQQKVATLESRLDSLTGLDLNPLSEIALEHQKAELSQEDIQVNQSGWFGKSLYAGRSAMINATPGTIIGGILGGVLGATAGFFLGAGIGAGPGAQWGASLGAIAATGKGVKDGLSQAQEKDKLALKREVSQIIKPFLEDSQRLCNQTVNRTIKALERELRDEFTGQIKQEKEALEKNLQSLDQARKNSQEKAAQRLNEIKQPLQQLGTIQSQIKQLSAVAQKMTASSSIHEHSSSAHQPASEKQKQPVANHSDYGDWADV